MTLMNDTLERRDFETPLGEKEPQTSFGSRSWKREGKDSTKSENKEDDADVKQETVIEDSVSGTYCALLKYRLLYTVH